MKKMMMLMSLTICAAAFGGKSKQTVQPDYTKGEVLEGENNYWSLGPIGALGNIWGSAAIGNGEQTQDTRMIQIRGVTKDTPADGVLEEGDVVLGVGNGTFTSDARKTLSAAVTEAEKKENGGKLVLTVWRHGKTMPVTLTIPIMGTFSDTSPWECEKTKAIIDAACLSIVKRGFFEKKGRSDEMVPRGSIATELDALGLLATGEEEYLPEVQKYARALGDPNVSLDLEKSSSWSWSYRTLFLTEYYLATKDDYVLPAIKEYATKIAMGRSGVGTWSHGMSYVKQNGLYGPPSAYGAMNQVSLTCTLSLILAQKCGIKSEEIDTAVKLSAQFMRWWVDKGTIPYGDHAPGVNHHDNNGHNSQAAVMFDLVGDKEAADYYTRMTLASYRAREAGHTGHFFSYQWGSLGAARGGDKAAQSFIRNTQWFTELERQPDGGFIYQRQLASIEHGKYKGWSTTGSRLLRYCLPRRKLYITGKGGSCISPIIGADLENVVAAGVFAPEKLTVKELLKALGSWSPVVRNKAAQELGEREEDVVKELIAMLDSPERYARYGASEGLSYAGRGSKEAIDALLEKLDDRDDMTMRYYAAAAFRKKRRWQGPPIRAWKPFKNALAKQGGAIDKAIPALLKQAATYEPVWDPGRKLQNELSETLFYGGNVSSFCGFFPDGKGVETVDRALLVPAVKSLLKNPNGCARTTVSAVFDRLTDKDLEQLWGDIYYATKYQAPSGVMFAGGVRTRGLDLMAKHKVKEGIEVGVDYALRQEGWGNGGRKKGGIPPLLSYGEALKDYVPEINRVLVAWGGPKVGSKNRPEDAEDFKKRLAEALQKPVPELMSIKPYIDRTPDPRADSAKK